MNGFIFLGKELHELLLSLSKQSNFFYKIFADMIGNNFERSYNYILLIIFNDENKTKSLGMLI